MFRASIIWLLLVSVAIAYPPGTIMVSRNSDERQNTSPGYFNHTAIVVSDTEIVESQEGQGIIRMPLAAYLARQYSRILAFKPRDTVAGLRAAKRAEQLVGRQYGNASSLLLGRGILAQRANCITAAVEISWGPEHRACRWIVKPDGMFRPRVKRPFLEPETIR